MARTHDGHMMLLTVGRNHILSLVALLFCDVVYVHCDVAFSMFFPVMVRWIDFLPSCYSCSSSVHSLTHVDLVLPSVEVFYFEFSFLSPLECFRISVGDILSALCDIKMYRTPIQTMSYDTVKYHMPLERSFIRYYKVSHAFIEKCRTTLEECCMPS